MERTVIHGLLKNRQRNRGRVAASLRSAAARGEFPNLAFGDYFKLAGAVCDAAAGADDAELDSFVQDCCGFGNGDGFTAFESKVTAKLANSDAVGGPLIDLISQLLPVLLPLILACFA